MRILIVTQFLIPHAGGLSSHIEDLIECHKKAGNQVTLIHGGHILENKILKGIRYFLSLFDKDAIQLGTLNKRIAGLTHFIQWECRKNNYDIIHSHDPVSGYAAQQVNMKIKVPVIQTFHGPATYEASMNIGKDIKESRYLAKLWEIEKFAYNSADKIIAVDTGQARIAIQDMEVNDAKVEIILNSVNCEEISKISGQPQKSFKEPFVLVPRRLVEKTGVHIAIRAISMLKDADISMVIAGDGPWRNQLENLANELQVSHRIIFLGNISRKDLLMILKKAFAVIIPSIPTKGVIEASSISALEAMACGTVVIASEIGGLAEIISNEKTGLLVQHSNPNILADTILRVYKNNELRNFIGHNSIVYVKDNLDINIWYKKILNVYSKTLCV